MPNRRLPATKAAPTLENDRADRPVPACDGEWALFWQLIDTPANPYTRRDAVKFCRTCPLRDKCLLDENREEEWAQVIVSDLVRIVVGEGAA